MAEQIRVAPDRGGGLDVTGQAETEMGHWGGALDATAETALDRSITGRPLGKCLQLGRRRQLCRRLTAKGQCQIVSHTEISHHGPHQQHRFADHPSGGRWFDHLECRTILQTSEPPFRSIESDRPLTFAPLLATTQQQREIGKILIPGRGQFDQFITIVVAEAVARSNPASADPALLHRTLCVEPNAGTQGSASLTGPQAQHVGGEAEREHRSHPFRQIETCGPAPCLQIQWAVRFDQPCGISDVDPDPISPGIAHQGEAVVDLACAAVIQRVNPMIGEIQTHGIPRLRAFRTPFQVFCRFQQLRFERCRPDTPPQPCRLIRIEQVPLHQPLPQAATRCLDRELLHLFAGIRIGEQLAFISKRQLLQSFKSSAPLRIKLFAQIGGQRSR